MRHTLLAGILLTLAYAAFADEAVNVVCPGGQYQCPSGDTCCRLSSGQWGCCPYAHAVCCRDHIHCCPSGYTCNVANGTCNRGDLLMPLATKNVAQPVEAVNVVCPGGQYQCPSGDTCCRLSSGQWGCCPYVHAVCCSDHIHCCPSGYTCNIATGTCNRGDLLMPLATKNVAQPVEAVNVVCPGGRYECRSGETCCKQGGGKYGCCPLPMAVCCNDSVHCCPKGYKCNVAHGTCTKGEFDLPWYEKNDAQQVELQSVVCPGGQYQCPDGNTCCKLSSGQWGCCPLPNAVCCSDHTHCCPSGYTCDVAQGSCSKGDLTVPWAEKNVAQPVEDTSVVCPGGQAFCPAGNTCCKLSSGQWGCCPFPNAVCCSDGQHCCPHGYTCDVSSGSCHQGELVIPWEEKNLAKPVEPSNGGIICPNSSSICRSTETCCMMAKGGWGCCPGVNAVCCPDKIHCCPHGTKCTKENTCVGAAGILSMVTKTKAKEMAPKVETVPWITKTLALPLGTKEGNVKCDSSHFCPDGNTCCKLASRQWGCCPLPNAVCCSDGIHCCPHGYTCDTASGRCQK